MNNLDIVANINFKTSTFIEFDFFKDDHFVVFRVASGPHFALFRVATKIFQNFKFSGFFSIFHSHVWEREKAGEIIEYEHY